MDALRQRCNWRAFLGKETNCVVAGVVDSRRWNFHLRTWFWHGAVSGEFVESRGGDVNTVHRELCFVAIDEVHEDLTLLQHLVTRARRHALDDGGEALSIAAGRPRLESGDDQKKTESDPCTDDERLLVNSAFHRPILAYIGRETPVHRSQGRFYGS